MTIDSESWISWPLLMAGEPLSSNRIWNCTQSRIDRVYYAAGSNERLAVGWQLYEAKDATSVSEGFQLSDSVSATELEPGQLG